MYEPLVAAGHDVVSIHLAEKLSGTCASARAAAAALPAQEGRGRLVVVDGQTGAGGLGCLVEVAARAAAAGASADAIVDLVREARTRLDIWFCLDTLEYLRRGERIGAAQALLGSALRIKPILTFGTEIAPIGKVRTRRRALKRMLGYLEELRDRDAGAWVVQHAQSPDDADLLVREGMRILGTAPLYCSQVGPVLGAHLGRGVLVGGIGGT